MAPFIRIQNISKKYGDKENLKKDYIDGDFEDIEDDNDKKF